MEHRARLAVERHHPEVEERGYETVAADRVGDELEGEAAFAVAGAGGVDLKTRPVLDQRLGRVVVLRRSEGDGQGHLGLGHDDPGCGQGEGESRAAAERGDPQQGDRGVAHVAHGGGCAASAGHHHRVEGEAALAGQHFGAVVGHHDDHVAEAVGQGVASIAGAAAHRDRHESDEETPKHSRHVAL